MISTSFILSTGLKKWMPTKFSGRALALARPLIGSVEVLLAKKPPGASIGSASCVTRGLELAVLEHRLDDQVAAAQVLDRVGRRDAREQGGLVVRRSCGPCRPAAA